MNTHLSEASAELLHVVELDFRKDPRWETFVSSHPDALIYHHPGWLAALESEYRRKCIGLACEDQQGHLRAILPLFSTKGLPLSFGRTATGRRLSSLPRTPIAGPLATDSKAAAAIVRYATNLASSQLGMQVELKTRMGGLHELPDVDLSRVPWRSTYVEELPTDVEGSGWEEFCENLRLPRTCGTCEDCRRLRFGNARRQHRVKWAVKKGLKLGLEVREAEMEEDLERWYQLYLLTMRHNAVPPRPYRFFKSLWESLHPSGRVRLLLAEQRKEGKKRLVAGSILLQFGQTVFYAFTGCAPKDLPLHAHDMLQMEAIRGACKAGFRWYDFGEVTEEHESLAQFKTKWGGDPKPLYRYYHPSHGAKLPSKGNGLLATLRRKVWRSLPLPATEVLGDLIYGRM